MMMTVVNDFDEYVQEEELFQQKWNNYYTDHDAEPVSPEPSSTSRFPQRP